MGRWAAAPASGNLVHEIREDRGVPPSSRCAVAVLFFAVFVLGACGTEPNSPGSGRVAVPSLSGQDPPSARHALWCAGLAWVEQAVVDPADTIHDPEVVSATRPPAGTLVKLGSTVTILVPVPPGVDVGGPDLTQIVTAPSGEDGCP